MGLLEEEDSGEKAADDGDRVVEDVKLRCGCVEAEEQDAHRDHHSDYVGPVDFFEKGPDKVVVVVGCVDCGDEQVQQEQVEESEVVVADAAAGESAVVIPAGGESFVLVSSPVKSAELEEGCVYRFRMQVLQVSQCQVRGGDRVSQVEQRCHPIAGSACSGK